MVLTLIMKANAIKNKLKLRFLLEFRLTYPLQNKYIPNKLKNNPKTSACNLVPLNKTIQNTDIIKDDINPTFSS